MRRFFYVLSAGAGLMLASLPTQAISLEEAVAAAIDNNPDVQQQYARYQSANSLQSSARGDYYPQVKLTGGYGREDTRYNSGQKIDEQLNRSEMGLTISQMLFNGFKTQADVERLSQEAKAERFALIGQAENTALEVCRIYLELLKSEQTLQLAQRNVQDHIAAHEDIKERLDRGLSSQSDLSQVTARLAGARASMISAKNNLLDRQAEYISLVGQNPESLIDPINDARLIPASLDAALIQAKQQHPELKVAKADIKAAKQEQRMANNEFYPRVSVEFAANKSEDIGGFVGPDEDARLMLKLEYDLFNGGRDKHRAKASGWRYQESMAIAKRTQLEVDQGTRLSWNARRFLGEQVALYKENVDATSEAHAGYIQQFRLGRRSLLDVLDSQVELFIARQNYIEAKYDYKYANYRVNNSVGSLLYSMRVEQPDQWQVGFEQ